MFYFFIAALFICIYWLTKTKDNDLDKLRKLAFGMFIFFFLAMEVFTFIENNALLYGTPYVFTALLNQNQTQTIVPINSNISGGNAYIQKIDGLRTNVTKELLTPLEFYVNATGIENFDTIIVYARYEGNISIRLIDYNNTETQIGVLMYPLQQLELPVDSTPYLQNKTVRFHFIDNTAAGTPNISIDYIGVDNKRITKPYDAQSPAAGWVVAQHELDYAAMQFMSALLAPGSVFFMLVVCYGYLKEWYFNKQRG